MIRSLSLSLSLSHLLATLPLEFPMPPRYPLAGNVELQLYFRQLVCVLLGNFLYNLNSSSGFGSVRLGSPIVPTQVVVHLPGPAPAIDATRWFCFRKQSGSHCTRTSADNGTRLGPRSNFAGSAKLLFSSCHMLHRAFWFPHSGQFNIYSPVFVFSSISLFFCFSP